MDFSAAGKCRFPKRPPVVLKDRQIEGFCKFDHGTQGFAGTAAEQARCLLNPLEPVGRLASAMDTLPAALERRVGNGTDLPSRETLAQILRDRGATQDLIDTLAQPVSHAHDNDPLSRSATYIVFHDTSTPNYRSQPWPKSIDDDPKINNLARYECSNDIERAHVFINRLGRIFLAHDFTVPWRATKFETAKNFGSALKGLFLHVELIQPRRALKGIGNVHVGMQLHTQSAHGVRAVTVTQIQGDMVTIDGNHPLAGQNLNFDVEIAEVRAATAEELAHGHVHGPGGHHDH